MHELPPVRRPALKVARAAVWSAAVLLGLSTPAWAGEAGWPPPVFTCPPCNDGNDCTRDWCDTTTGTCHFDPPIVRCDDGNPCTIENEQCCPDFNQCGFFGGCEVYDYAPVGTACNDGNPCTVESACDAAGRCVGQPASSGTACDDANPCTLESACDGSGLCVGAPLPVGSACDDGSLCTLADACRPTEGGGIACQGVSRDCDDGNACTLDACEPSTGTCENRSRDCGDGNFCTAESCDPVLGCVRVPVSSGCPFGDLCTGADFCVRGNCYSGGGCGSGGDCVDVYCDPWLGCVYQEFSGGTCDLGTLCEFGFCIRGSCDLEHAVVCDDGDQLTQDVCEASTGDCVYLDLCDDRNPCTADSRDASSGTCTYAPVEGSCDDRNACTTADACVSGTCQGTPITCSDGDVCTDDSCDRVAGCVFRDNTRPCDDNNACTIGDVCGFGECRGLPRPCGDGNPCTEDSCDPLSGCVFTPADIACEDGDPCTTGDVCRDGACISGSGLECDDENACTIDTCDASGCINVVDPALPDQDADSTPDSCDNCPTIANPGQDPAACEQSVVDILLGDLRGAGRRAKSVRWRTTHELDVAGFNVLAQDDDGAFRTLNRSLIPCQECTTGAGAWYLIRLRLRGGEIAVFVELVHADGRTETFGPAQ